MVQKLIDSGKMKSGWTEPEDVAEAIVNQLYSGYGAQIIVPSYFWWVSLQRGFPAWLQEKLRNSVSQALLKANG